LTQNAVLKRLCLRTHPLAPDVGGDGQPLDPKLVERPLDPKVDGRLLSYYFDVYDWTSASQLGGFGAAEGLKSMPVRGDAPGAMPVLILVSGPSESGRSSLANLLVFEIAKACAAEPFVCPIAFDSYNQAECCLAMANAFIDRIELTTEIDPAPLWKLYEREKGNPGSGPNSKYKQIFGSLALRVRPQLKRPVVFFVDRSPIESYDLWACAYNSVADLADYIIIQTGRSAFARTCREQFGDKSMAVHVESRPLTLALARAYLKGRVTAERGKAMPVTGNPLWPFSESALTALYEPGTTRRDIEVQHPIGLLRRTLERAVNEQIAELELKVMKTGENVLLELTDDDLEIDDAVVKRVRDKMNRGQ